MRPVDSRQVAKAEADEAENAHADAAHLEQAGLEKDIILHFAPGDVDNPRNWSAARKYYIVVLVCMLNIWTTLCKLNAKTMQIKHELGSLIAN